MIKAIVFDIGGVLINLDMDGCIRAFRSNLGFDRITELLDPCHQKGVYGDMEAGLVSADEFRAEVLRDSRPGSQPEDVDRSMLALLAGMAPDTVETLKALKERYPLYLLSNNNPIAMGHILRMFRDYGIDPETTFREQFISCEMKMLKPSARIYEAVVAGIGLPADEILFVDDSETNVEAARKAGLQARTFVPGTKLSALLSEL